MDTILKSQDQKRNFRIRAIAQRDPKRNVTSWKAVVEITSNLGGGRSLVIGTYRTREVALAAANTRRATEMASYEVGL